MAFDGGGAGNSTASTTNNTENTDMRVVGGADSVNSSLKFEMGGDHNTASLVLTDHGAVDGALKLAFKGIEGANGIATQTIAAQGGLLTGALRMAGEQQQAFTSAVENIKTSDVRVLVVAGLAVVGLGATMIFKKG